MKTIFMAPVLTRSSLWLFCAVLFQGLCLVRGQANERPPEIMSYQGYLTDVNGAALSTDRARNYNVFFRIYNHPTASDVANNLKWAETQIVTVDKGYFSVMLG